MREALVDVLVDDVGLVEDQIPLDQDGHLAVGVHDTDVLGLVVEVDIADLEIHALLEQDETAAVGEGAGRARVQHHHGGKLLKNGSGWDGDLAAAQRWSK